MVSRVKRMLVSHFLNQKFRQFTRNPAFKVSHKPILRFSNKNNDLSSVSRVKRSSVSG